MIKEQKRIEESSPQSLAVKASKLRKVFGNKVAVKGTSFGLEFGD